MREQHHEIVINTVYTNTRDFCPVFAAISRLMEAKGSFFVAMIKVSQDFLIYHHMEKVIYNGSSEETKGKHYNSTSCIFFASNISVSKRWNDFVMKHMIHHIETRLHVSFDTHSYNFGPCFCILCIA